MLSNVELLHAIHVVLHPQQLVINALGTYLLILKKPHANQYQVLNNMFSFCIEKSILMKILLWTLVWVMKNFTKLNSQ